MQQLKFIWQLVFLDLEEERFSYYEIFFLTTRPFKLESQSSYKQTVLGLFFKAFLLCLGFYF